MSLNEFSLYMTIFCFNNFEDKWQNKWNWNGANTKMDQAANKLDPDTIQEERGAGNPKDGWMT